MVQVLSMVENVVVCRFFECVYNKRTLARVRGHLNYRKHLLYLLCTCANVSRQIAVCVCVCVWVVSLLPPTHTHTHTHTHTYTLCPLNQTKSRCPQVAQKHVDRICVCVCVCVCVCRMFFFYFMNGLTVLLYYVCLYTDLTMIWFWEKQWNMTLSAVFFSWVFLSFNNYL